MRLSFFAKKPFFRENKEYGSGLYLQRTSSIIRAQEIAEYLGAKYNPTERYGGDTCIYVKPESLDNISDMDYVDVLDDRKLTVKLKDRPEIKVIAMSGPHYKWLKSILDNQIILIPHHHINFERVRRPKRKVRVCGYVGTWKAYHVGINEKIRERLKGIGVDFIELFNYKTRDDIIDFYKKIDVQIIGHFSHVAKEPQYHPSKIVNAMSFGIPTISGVKVGYQDVDGFYIKARNFAEIVEEVERLKNDEYYYQWVEKIIPFSEIYHIERISKLYGKLHEQNNHILHL